MRAEAKFARRRRTLAGSLIVTVAVIVVAVVTLGGGGGPSPRAATTAQTGASGASTTSTRPRSVVRNGPRGIEPVPILIYHVILAAPPGAPFPGLYVTPTLFAAQMHALAAAGYHAVTMNEMWDNWRYGRPLPAGRPIVISFDNGYATQYTSAFPVLRSLGWLGVENLQLSGLPPSQGGLSRHQVRLMVHAGWELDTQGYSHADLITLSPSELHFQVAVARARLRALYHATVEWFCYPSGHYDAAVIAAVRAAGFRGATTVVHGWANPTADPFRLPRLEVLGTTSPSALLALIAGSRDDPPPGPSYPAA